MNTLQSRLLVTASAVAITCSSLASADPYNHHGHDDRHYYHDDSHWREGRWYHGDHSGHMGWWWIAGSMWYFYPTPVYPYPSPYVPSSVVVEQQPVAVTAVPPPAPVWYYCNSSRNYYPYVSVCPEGWQAVPAQPNDAPVR